MSFPSCPRCREEVTLPSGTVRPEASVSCPLCKEEFPLSEVLSKLPPQLVVVGRTVLKSPPLKLEKRASEFDAVGGDAVGPTDEAFGFDAYDTSPRPKRSNRRQRTRSPLRAAVGIFGGGILGLLLAVGILWWGFEKDPFEIGPPVSRYAPWIVPARFKVPTDLSLGASSHTTLRPIDLKNRFEPNPDSSSRASNGIGSLDDSPPSTEDRKVPDPGPASAADRIDLDRVTAPPISLEPATTLSPTARPESTAREAGGASTGVRVPLRSAPVYSEQQLEDSLLAAEALGRTWRSLLSEVDPKKRDPALRDFYTSLVELGEKMTFTPDTQRRQQLVAQADGLVAEISAQPTGLDDIERAAVSWMKSRRSGGTLLYGAVKSIRMRGNLYESEIELAKSRRFTVISAVDPSSLYGLESKVLIFGSIIDQPATAMQDYKGSADFVVLSGHPVLLSSPSAP